MTTKTPKFFVVKAPAGFFGCFPGGTLKVGVPAALAYTYSTEAEARGVAAGVGGAALACFSYEIEREHGSK